MELTWRIAFISGCGARALSAAQRSNILERDARHNDYSECSIRVTGVREAPMKKALVVIGTLALVGAADAGQ